MESERLPEALAIERATTKVCCVCGGPWGLTRPQCDIKGECEGGYIVTGARFDELGRDRTRASQEAPDDHQ